MKVIFLDVDGVLNTDKTRRKWGKDFIDDILVGILARIVRETGAVIVLSSTWREEAKDRKLVKDALATHGIEVFDVTPKIESRGWSIDGGVVLRHVEIAAWLRENEGVEKFAILDDNVEARIEGSFFKTDSNIGLTVTIADSVISHFN